MDDCENRLSATVASLSVPGFALYPAFDSLLGVIANACRLDTSAIVPAASASYSCLLSARRLVSDDLKSEAPSLRCRMHAVVRLRSVVCASRSAMLVHFVSCHGYISTVYERHNV
jgi:hypothetical protein